MVAIISFGFSYNLFADLALPGELEPKLIEKEFTLKNKQFKVIKRIFKQEVMLKVVDGSGKLFWKSGKIGDQEKLFQIGNKSESLVVKDLNGDNIPEIITAAMTGPGRSNLQVFKLVKNGKRFKPVKFEHKKQKLIRSFAISDIYQKDGQDFVFTSDKELRVLGKIYVADSAPKYGFYYFKLEKNGFVCSKIEPVPGN